MNVTKSELNSPSFRRNRQRAALGSVAAALVALALSPSVAGAACLSPPGDVNGNGITNIVDVQCAMVSAVWLLAGADPGSQPTCVAPSELLSSIDANCDGQANVSDLSILISNALGAALSTLVDADGSGCADACEAPPPPTGVCCDEQPQPGCELAPCESCVCALDSFCCEQAWDALCGQGAVDNCSAACECNPPEPGNCCEVTGAADCLNSECSACVCAVDPFCCQAVWDNACVAAASNPGVCRGTCGCGAEPPPPVCGDAICDTTEICGTPTSCAADCGACECVPSVNCAILCGADSACTDACFADADAAVVTQAQDLFGCLANNGCLAAADQGSFDLCRLENCSPQSIACAALNPSGSCIDTSNCALTCGQVPACEDACYALAQTPALGALSESLVSCIFANNCHLLGTQQAFVDCAANSCGNFFNPCVNPEPPPPPATCCTYDVQEAGTVLAGWTFETSIPTTAGPHAPEQGAQTANAGLRASHASPAAVYSNPSGNGSPEALSANNWAIGDFYEANVSTLGFNRLSVSWSQTRSNTGPAEFELQYSVDGANYLPITTYTVAALSFSAATANPAAVYGPFALPAQAADAGLLSLRLVAKSAPTQPAGTNRIDDVRIFGEAITQMGCGDTDCEFCVAAADAFCAVAWDATCTAGAQSTCAAECGCN